MERRADDSEVGVGPGPLSRIPEAARQAVLDAAAVLQVRRSEAAAQVARGELPDVVIVARGHQGINDWIREASTGWRELLSVRPGGTAAELAVMTVDSPSTTGPCSSTKRRSTIFIWTGATLTR